MMARRGDHLCALLHLWHGALSLDEGPRHHFDIYFERIGKRISEATNRSSRS